MELSQDVLTNDDIKRQFIDFLDQDYGENRYTQKIGRMMEEESTRLVVNLNTLREFRDGALAKHLLLTPTQYLPIFCDALNEYVNSINPEYTLLHGSLEIGLEGSFGSRYLTPRGLNSRFISQMVCIEGIVSKCSLVRPKVQKSVHYCPQTQQFTEREYRDGLSLGGLPTNNVYPKTDKDGNLLETEFGLSQYCDIQTLTIQEMPERAPAGLLPRSIDVVLTKDLVDVAKPGDRLLIVGLYKPLPSKSGGSTNGIFKAVLLANHIKPIGKEAFQPTFTDVDIKNIKQLASGKQGAFEVLSRSIAPSIYGHEEMKRAILCLLLGGCEKNFENGTHIRGDINMLMIGDPSTAKSQLLRYVLNMAPLAIATTGRGSTGVGLTAAVTTDQDSGERRLEAGAMVLADRGVVCIDEFDKMSDDDRVAIHEVMEQQTVTIAKAGIHTSLNARCSVLAAANPIYGQYDTNLDPMRNISMPDSLLSRFDLLFIVLDKNDPEHDSTISDHVLRMHRYRKPGEPDGTALQHEMETGPLIVEDGDQDQEVEHSTPMYQKYDAKLHGKRQRGVNDKILTQDFLKKYLHYCKTRIRPVLSQEASDAICEEYAKLRSSTDIKTLPITARTLETFIRVSTAIAKSRLSNSVSETDVECAVSVIQYSLYKYPEKTHLGKKKAAEAKEGATSDTEDDSDGDDATRGDGLKAPASGADGATFGEGPEESTEEMSVDLSGKQSALKRPAEEGVGRRSASKRAKVASETVGPAGEESVTEERRGEIMTLLKECFMEAHADSLDKSVLEMHMNSKQVTSFQLAAVLEYLEKENKLYAAGDKVYLL